jgi:transcriptional/translational regulatory protein YebC/TACO1
LNIAASRIQDRPKNPVSLKDSGRKEVEAFLEATDAGDDVRNIYAGLAG